jgi:hypothetical protein
LDDLNVIWEDNIKMDLTIKIVLATYKNNNDNNSTPIFIGLHKILGNSIKLNVVKSRDWEP